MFVPADVDAIFGYVLQQFYLNDSVYAFTEFRPWPGDLGLGY